MSACRSFGRVATAWALLVVPASGVEPAGSEFLVNSHTPLGQFSPSIAANDDGNFVVVWSSSGQEDSSPLRVGVFGQRFASDGSSLGSEFQVNTYTIGYQSVPDVAVDGDLDFFVVWQSFDDQDGNASGVFGQRYSSSGAPLGGELRVSSYTLGS